MKFLIFRHRKNEGKNSLLPPASRSRRRRVVSLSEPCKKKNIYEYQGINSFYYWYRLLHVSNRSSHSQITTAALCSRPAGAHAALEVARGHARHHTCNIGLQQVVHASQHGGSRLPAVLCFTRRRLETIAVQHAAAAVIHTTYIHRRLTVIHII